MNMEKKICPKCNSPKWMTGLQTQTEGEGTVAVRRPTWKQGAEGSSRVYAEACGACGYVEYFLETPGTTYQAWRKHNT